MPERSFSYDTVALGNSQYSSAMCVRSPFMKWEEPPLWPVAIPSGFGFLIGVIPYLTEVPYLSKESIDFSVLVLLIAALSLFLLNERYGNKFELYAGYLAGICIGFLPIKAFSVWFIIVGLTWVFQSTYMWKYNFPPFRIGIWIALGSMTGLYVGGIVAYNIP
ncbi:MAG: hypothetical protein HN534_05190 [Euryarchaeota archaeon]|nr:hypothetical protein [Euryarchaeota archaeon]MBT3654305.1 hypothetical protein [Euryarchaeota archaeon]MBT3758009.1 hypothetical protein [Euryarchaeota archaeon]MBT4050367.1 hypothetical protein [Euryarchaeota archaeon]MBT4347104.1 hypothetical protein [Euryarchaeota archaeon]